MSGGSRVPHFAGALNWVDMGLLAAILGVVLAAAAIAAEVRGDTGPVEKPAAQTEPQSSSDSSRFEADAGTGTGKRIELNLLGKTDTQSGESRRNENVHFNLIDNNALKDLNLRMGTTATIVEEFQPDRSYYGVEFGNPPPPSLHLVPAKIAALHGSLYESHNNSVFSARSFFQAGGVKPAHDNDFGFTFGAPLWRGARLSLDGSQQRIRGSVNGNILVPKADERTPLATDPAVRAIVQRFLNAYPAGLPNRTDIDPRALNTNSPQAIDTSNADGHLDQNFGVRDRLIVQYGFTAQRVNAFELLAGQNPDARTAAHTARITWNRAWAAHTILDASAGFDRIRSVIVPEPNAVGPSVSFGNVISDLGPGNGIPIDRTQNMFRYGAQIRQVRGRHAWTAGAGLLRRQVNGVESSSERGTLQFRNDFGRDAITNFLMGLPSRYSGAIGDVSRGFRNWDMQYYAGGDWRPAAGLTLSYGLRYQPVTKPNEVNHRSVIPYGCDCNNLAPRFGFAWRLPGSWGLLRAAYGLDYGQIFPVTFQQVRFNPPGNLKFEVQTPGLVNPLAGVDTGPGARSTIYDIAPNLVTPYEHQYNFSWEPLRSTNWKLQLGYVGSRSHKLLIFWPANRAVPVPGIDQTTATVNLRRPDPTHYEIRKVLNGSRGYFDAGRITLGVPRWRGLSLDASYWFSKALDLGGSYTNTAAGDDATQGRSQSESLVQQDLKGPSPFDQSHAFLLRLAYGAPSLAGRPGWLRRPFHNWSVTAVYLMKTGMPFTVFTGSDGPGFGNVDGSPNDRPNLLDPSILGRTIDNPDTARRLLPRSAFGFIAPTEARGNLGSNTFRRAGIRNVNAAISRTWSIRSEKALTLRAESVNLLNTPQFDAPAHDLTSPSFGRITNTLNDGRTFRFLLRFSF
jgi:hypothetical protein